MTEYTKDIKQLKQTASSTPQFAQPASSLGADLVNLAGTGLQFYQQQQAKKELGFALEAQSAQNKLMATGQEKLREIRLLSQQGVSATDIRKREEALKKNYSPEAWWGILSETNKVSRTTSAEAMSTADKALQKQVADREALQMDVNGVSPYIPFDVDLDADEDTLREALLIGKANLAEVQAKKARVDLRSSELTVKGKESDIAREKFVIDFQSGTENVYIKQANHYISQANLDDPQQVSELIAMNDNLKRMFINQAVISAKDAGVTLTPTQAEAQFAPQLKAFDTVSRRLSGKDVKDIGANRMAAQVTNTLLAMKSAGTPAEQNLATLFMFSEFLPKDALGSKILGAYGTALADNLKLGGRGDMASVFRAAPNRDSVPTTPLEIKAQNTEKQARFKRIKDIFKNVDGSIPQETKDVYTDVMLEDLQGSKATQKEMLEGGGFVAYVQAMSKGTPTNLISADKQDEVVEGIMDYADKFLRRAIPQLLTEQTPSDSSLFTKPIPPRGFEVGLPTTALENKLNALDPDTLKVTWNQKAAISDNVKSYNKFIDDLFVSLDKLNVTEEETKYLKNEISRAFVVANNADAVD